MRCHVYRVSGRFSRAETRHHQQTNDIDKDAAGATWAQTGRWAIGYWTAEGQTAHQLNKSDQGDEPISGSQAILTVLPPCGVQSKRSHQSGSAFTASSRKGRIAALSIPAAKGRSPREQGFALAPVVSVGAYVDE